MAWKGQDKLNVTFIPPPSGLADLVADAFGPPLIAVLPSVSPDGDHADAFQALARSVQDADVVLFADILPGSLDAFFYLRLLQVLEGRPPVRGLCVVALAACDDPARPLAGGFADRFRSAWPFARCVFVTDSDAAAALSAGLGVPVSRLTDGEPPPPVLRTEARAGQKVAVQVQITWGRCGSTTVFENQVESLVRAGFLTIRLFWNGQMRRGPTLAALLDRIIPENGVHAGAHVSLLAVPPGPPPYVPARNVAEAWAGWLAIAATARVTDQAATQAARTADIVIANHIDTVGTALRLCPGARLLLEVHDDQAQATRERLTRANRPPEEVEAVTAEVAHVQAGVLAIPDISAHISASEMERLGRQSPRAAIVLPRIYTKPAPAAAPRFDVLAVADGHPVNIASLRWFLDAVWRPYLAPHSVRVAVVGRAGAQLDSSLYASPLLHFLGFIEDLDTFRSWCRLSVVPDQGGTGVSIKLLTALAAHHPLVTTPVGVRGLDAAVAGSLPACDDPAAFAADILDLLRDPERLEERRRRVARANEAIRQGAGYAALAAEVPPPDERAKARRAALWANVVAAAPAADPASFVFAPGTVFAMSGSLADRSVLESGWHAPEAWGRWTDGADATLRVTLPAPTDKPLKLELDLTPSDAGGTLTLGIDGTRFAAIEPAAVPARWDVPAEAVAAKDNFLVALHVSETICPAASGDDRILGIGVRSVRVDVYEPTLCELGAFLPVDQSAAPRDVLLSGWHALEPWGCWSSGKTATLRLQAAEPLSGAILLELDLQATQAAPPLTLSANGWTAPARDLLAGINRWDLPPEATDGSRALLVTLSVPATFNPARADESDDDRELGVGLRRARISRFVPAVIALGVPLRLGAPADTDGVRTRGWHKPEPWGCWTSQAEAEMRLAYGQNLAGAFRLDMELSVPPVPTLLTVTVNGRPLPPVAPANGLISWDIADGLLQDQPVLVIGLRVSDTFCAADHGSGEDDRALGIGVRSVTLHRAIPDVFPVGRAVWLGGGNGGRALVAGWHRPEPWGCWTSGQEAVLRLAFDAPLAGPYSLELNLAPPLLDPDVSIAVNGTELEPTFVADGFNAWKLPAACTEGRTTLEVVLRVERPACPCHITASVDDRLLGVGLRGFRLVPPSNE